jgi:hypothetical protein
MCSYGRDRRYLNFRIPIAKLPYKRVDTYTITIGFVTEINNLITVRYCVEIESGYRPRVDSDFSVNTIDAIIGVIGPEFDDVSSGICIVMAWKIIC